jgi:hypothetical protein
MAMEAEERTRSGEPGVLASLLVILAMIGITAVLFVLIYVLMLGVSSIDARKSAVPAEATVAMPLELHGRDALQIADEAIPRTGTQVQLPISSLFMFT